MLSTFLKIWTDNYTLFIGERNKDTMLWNVLWNVLYNCEMYSYETGQMYT